MNSVVLMELPMILKLENKLDAMLVEVLVDNLDLKKVGESVDSMVCY